MTSNRFQGGQRKVPAATRARMAATTRPHGGCAIAACAPGLVDRAAFALARPWVLILAFAFLLTPSAWLVAALNSGASFLKIGTGARPAAMGEAYTSLADDINALYYNPAGLARLPKREFGATHTEWLLGTKFDFLGYGHPTKLGTFGVGVTRLTAGSQDFRDANRQAAGSFEAMDTAYTLGFSRKAPEALRIGSGDTALGANVKFLESKLAGYLASTLALDLGAHHRFQGRPLSLGVSVLNLGKGMRFLDQLDPLPLTLSAGASCRLAGSLELALDLRHEVYDRSLDVGFGTEYSLLPSLSLRMGYASGLSGISGGGVLGGFGGVGAGFGLKLGRFRTDYTVTPMGSLGNSQRVSLGARF